MKQILLVLAIGLLSMTTQAQTRTFNTQVRLNNLAEPQATDSILTINSDNKISFVAKSDLGGGTESTPQTLNVNGNDLSISGGNTVSLPQTAPQTLTLSGNDLSIAGGNTVTLPTSGGSGEAIQTESGTFTMDIAGNWTGYGQYSRIGNVVSFTLDFLFIGTLQGTQPFRTFVDVLPYRAIGNTAVSVYLRVAVKDDNRTERLYPTSFVKGKRVTTLFYDNSTFDEFGEEQTGTTWNGIYFGEIDTNLTISGSYITNDPFN